MRCWPHVCLAIGMIVAELIINRLCLVPVCFILEGTLKQLPGARNSESILRASWCFFPEVLEWNGRGFHFGIM